MTIRRNRLEVEKSVLTGEIIAPVKRNTNVDFQLKEMENNHALSMRKMEVASDVVQIGKQIVNILEIRANSAAKINEIDANIRQLEKITQHEIETRRQARKGLESKGKVVAEILKELTPVLLSHQLSTEDRKAAMEMYDHIIEKVLKDE